ncbi:MAG TPA: hypothetical protein HA252_01075 [Candidatus Diapherotrites archaeon]|uniref:Uncharacterized protein n=1 Tax=Candidatus Iainarchaeum sp. TaxID=3101447 RepID=A0A7J4JJ66_9ARCH|nr:hypothetical protein [Candidatus Diapherotrites archaeon]HIH15977.1 hypothetical protein [Candidatus Diapherotrites archaeon]
MDKTMILTILVGAMVLVSALQTIQLFGLSNALSGAQVGGGSLSAAKAPATTAKAPVAVSGGTSLKNLPSMVGGC